MMRDRSAVVGAFVFGAMLLAVAAILFFGGARYFQRSVSAVVFFHGSVGGLDVGAPVTFRGVRVGSVRRIAVEIAPKGEARIPVYIELLPSRILMERDTTTRATKVDIEQLVDEGLRAYLSLQSFVTGQLRVDLNFRPDTPAEMTIVDTHGIPQIPPVPSDFERLQNALVELPLQDLAQAMINTMRAVEKLAGRVDAKLDPLVEDTRRALDNAARAMATTEQAVTRLQADASRTLGTVDEMAGHAERQIDDRGAQLAALLDTTDRAARQVETLLASMNDLTAPRARFREDLEAAARDLAASASSLRGFSRQIERNPGTLLRGTSP